MSSGRVIVRIDKPPYLGVIIPALEIVQLRLFVVDIPTVPQRVIIAQCICHVAGGRDQVAPGIVDVMDDCGAVAVQDGDDISLEVGDVVVGFAAFCVTLPQAS